MSDNELYIPSALERRIESERYHRFPGTNVVVCCIKLESGWASVGYSSCLDANRFDEVEGERRAYKNALRDLLRSENYHRIHSRE